MVSSLIVSFLLGLSRRYDRSKMSLVSPYSVAKSIQTFFKKYGIVAFYFKDACVTIKNTLSWRFFILYLFRRKGVLYTTCCLWFNDWRRKELVWWLQKTSTYCLVQTFPSFIFHLLNIVVWLQGPAQDVPFDLIIFYVLKTIYFT